MADTVSDELLRLSLGRRVCSGTERPLASPQAGHGTETLGRDRRLQNLLGCRPRERGDRLLLPVGVIVLVYVVAGTLWIFGSGPVADTVTEATSIPRWGVELGKGVLFVTVTALVLQVVLRRRADQLVAVASGAQEDGRRLTESEARNRLQATALSGTANAVVITGRDGTIEWVNPAFETMTGYPSTVAVGATPRLLHSGEHDETFYRELWDTILAGQVWRGQVVNRRADGALYTVSQTITPVVTEAGEVQNFVAIHEDITERVRAAGELEASRVRLQSLIDHAIDAIVLADDHGRYIEVNPAMCGLTGYSRDELLEMGPADLAAPDQQPIDVATQFDEFVRAGTESGTFALRHRDGHVVETEFRAVSNIQPGVHLSVLRDVTVRYSMLRALTAAEAEFRELAENAADIVTKLRIDGDGRLQVDYVNPAATTILGYPRQRFYDDPDLLLRLFHQRRDDLDVALDLLPTPAEPIRLATVQVQRPDDRLVWLEVHSTLTDPTTAPVTIQLVGRDVTARAEMTQALEQALDDQLEAAEQLRALNAMKDTFLQSVSHELRTPLTAILGFAQLLADPRHGLSPTDTREFHHRILNNAQRLQRLLDDLLDVDRFTRGQIEANRQPTDLAGLIERMVGDIGLGEHPVDLDLEPITMGLDTPWIERLVANLLRNIVRHTPADTRVWIRTRATTDGVELTVDDDGPGIPEADRQRVIEPFQQGPETASSAQPGTGVGLSLVNTFAQIHGGDLTVTVSPAGGARMTVTLAHAEPDEPGTSAGTSVATRS
jgi:PAS domain S-box-containing protein